MQFNYFTYKKESVKCLYCGWTGKGSELRNGDFSEEHFIGDLNCPSCGEMVGFWQAPLNAEYEKWARENPEAAKEEGS
jgi:hypothetical protein